MGSPRKRSERQFCVYRGCFRPGTRMRSGNAVCPHHADMIDRETEELAAVHRLGGRAITWIGGSVLAAIVAGVSVALARHYGIV